MASGIFLDCAHCGNRYHTHSGKQIYCSNACQFWSKVDRRAPDECWPWIAKARNKHGYGVMRLRGERRNVKASRYAWILTHGEIASRALQVCHKCDNPSCCNPAHLFLGTALDNTRDMRSKNRHWVPTEEFRNRMRVLYSGKKRPAIIGQRIREAHARRKANVPR